MAADVCITEYTDPGCPWAYSAEPFRRRLNWLYGDLLEWKVRLVGLAETPDEYAERSVTPKKQAQAFASIARNHGMPIDTSVRPHMAATMPACRAVLAARLHAPEAERALRRRLRIRHFSGQLLDEPETIHGAARDAGIEPDSLDRWTAEPAVEEALSEDMAAARHLMAQRASSTPSSPTGRAGGATPARRTRSFAPPTACASPCPASSPSRSTTSSPPTSSPAATAATRRTASRRCCAGRVRRWPPRRSPSCATSRCRTRARGARPRGQRRARGVRRILDPQWGLDG